MARRKRAIVRRRGTTRRTTAGMRGSALELAAGGVAKLIEGVVENQIDKSGTVGSKWWLMPALMGVGGHLIKKRRNLANVGTAMLGAAGYAMVQNYNDRGSSASVSAEESTDTEGYYEEDTGILIDPDDEDTGILIDPDDEVTGYFDGPTSAYEDVGDVDDDDDDEESSVAEAMYL